jgi:nucleotide-binding universal stress UspA family protein
VQVGLLERARKRVREAADALPDAAGLEVNVRARSGRPAREILGEVRESPMDLVVMATHGRTGLAHALLGSVTEKVVRTCSCPVLTVKAGEEPPAGAIRDVLFPTDLSEASLAALAPASELARSLGGSLTAIHVLEEPRLSIGSVQEVLDVSPETLQERFEKRARAVLRDSVESRLPEGTALKVMLLGGVAHEEIVREASKGAHDLVVMATQGRSGIADALVGSTAERVVRTCPVPVMTVHAGG